MHELKTGIKDVRNVLGYTIGDGALSELPKYLISARESSLNKSVVFFIDDFFEKKKNLLGQLMLNVEDKIIFVSTGQEPTTDYVNKQLEKLKLDRSMPPAAIIGLGGGATLDVAKAISNLITNKGRAEDYQGWDLLRVPGVYKIGIPTISGTGSEATRTCVLTNKKTGLKLGMNSHFTVFDQIILDPQLTMTVPRNQYFFTGMDAYIHCIESLNGSYRNAIGDAYSHQAIRLCREVFEAEEMMSDDNRTKLMVASYLGGCAIATSYVGIIHPLSAALSVVLGTRHCLANCITMRAMEEFYSIEFKDFWKMAEKQKIEIPKGLCKNLTQEQYNQLYDSTLIHEKPLLNALGKDFKDILHKEKVIGLFKKM